MTQSSSTPPSRLPLDGIRVLDCATIIAAPFAAMLLADYGADVIKVEHPRGDGLRLSGPQKDGVGLSYAYYGRNKRNVVIDFSTAEGQSLLKDLAAKSDVLIENFRPGVMERWNLGWDALHAINPRLVMLRMTGFGQFGPYSGRPGFGTLAESMSGFAHINGYPDGSPTLPPFGLADGIAGVSAAYAVMLALYNRDQKGGAGQMIDVAIIEPILHLMGAQATIFDQLGKIQGRTGNRTINNAPRNVYKTNEGRWVAISTSAQAIAERVMQLVGRPDLIDEPWFRSGPERAKHADLLDGIVGAWIGERSLDEVIRAFEEAGAAVAPIYDIAQVCEDPQYRALESITTVEDPTLGPIRMQNLMFRMSETPGRVRHPGPRLGQHTDDVLRELLGLSDERLRALHAAGVIEPSPGNPSSKRAAA
jgi:crotonobetainyl-CoA:carnitine CoA-transferase CaiB-like acyl-CoA transferase